MSPKSDGCGKRGCCKINLVDQCSLNSGDCLNLRITLLQINSLIIVIPTFSWEHSRLMDILLTAFLESFAWNVKMISHTRGGDVSPIRATR